MKAIYVLGAGGFAKEVWFLINEINKIKPQYVFKGFIDEMLKADSLNVGDNTFDVIDKDIFLDRADANKENINIAVGIGNPQVIRRITQDFSGYVFPNLIHPGCYGYFDSIKLGQGNIITAGCNFTVNIKIGSFNIFNLNTTVGHDCVIKDFNIINPGVNLSGGLVIGSCNLIGTGAAILQNLKIGSESIIGAGAVLTKDLESRKLAVGVPAKTIKDL